MIGDTGVVSTVYFTGKDSFIQIFSRFFLEKLRKNDIDLVEK